MEWTTQSSGESHAAEYGPRADVLFGTLYGELHRLARRELSRLRMPANLGTTTLLHEAYLDMARHSDPLFSNRAQFMGYAAKVMRGLIIDNVRRHRSLKRGGEFQIASLDEHVVAASADPKELLEISDALDQLANVEPELANIVDLKFFCGFCFAEIAAMLHLSERTVQRKWEKARLYLRSSMIPAFAL